MASEIQDTLARLKSKCYVLVQKYQALNAQHAQVSEELEKAQSTIASMRQQIEKLNHENYYLKMASSLAPSSEQVKESKATLSKIVRDIDRCISQLNA
ncbi:MAG: hypothetical protein IJ808_03310 [Muribaculaceae bacterium]|nr:hypothetical protein [Muribaculaceae bacterium]